MDIDGDGRLDIVSGSFDVGPKYDGAPIKFLKASSRKYRFEPSEPLLTVGGNILLPLDPNVEATEENARHLSTKKLRNYRGVNNFSSTKQHLVDINNDGNLDLIYGSGARGGVFNLFYGEKNKGIKRFANKSSFLEYPDGELLTLPDKEENGSRYNSPHLADWDQDGDLDLFSGSQKGGVFYFENKGTPEQASWERPVTILPKHDWVRCFDGFNKYRRSPEYLIERPQYVTTVSTVDYNNDGKLDLVVGDHYTLRGPIEGVSDEDYALKTTQLDEMTKGEEPASISEYRRFERSFTTHEDKGHVWVFLRK